MYGENNLLLILHATVLILILYDFHIIIHDFKSCQEITPDVDTTFAVLKRKLAKIEAFMGFRTLDFCNTGAGL